MENISQTLPDHDLLRKLPANVHAEQMLLGAVLINSDLIEQINEFLKAEHFYEKFHQKIYHAIEILVEKGLSALLLLSNLYLRKILYTKN